MERIVFHLFFLILLFTGCSNPVQEKIKLLNEKIIQTPLLSTEFDSLMIDINQLSNHQRVDFIIRISSKKENADGILKQEKLLYDILPVASKTQRKEILFRLVQIYNEQDRSQRIESSLKGLDIINKLEREYSFKQEERWYLNKIKANFFNKQGKQKEYLSIWYKLLKEHRSLNRFELIIEDLYIIANTFEQIGDKEKAIMYYKEAHQLSREKQEEKFTKQYLLLLTQLLCDNKHYKEAISYCNDSSIFDNILTICYLGINETNKARSILNKRLAIKGHDRILLNLQMAETYILEENESSASIFLEKAINSIKPKSKHHITNNQSLNYPLIFMQTFSMYAELLQKSGKTIQAQEVYKRIEPLIKEEVPTLNWKEKQIKAINSYSTFCRSTKQYEKALDLLLHRDSLQHIYNTMKEEQEKTNLIHQFEIEGLNHQINVQDIELGHSKKLNVILTFTGLVVALLLTTIGLLFKNRKESVLKLYEQHEKLQKYEENSKEIKEEEITSSKALFIKVEKKVIGDKLFLRNDLTVEMLSGILNSNRTYVSGCVNEHKGKSFSAWINDLRVDYATKLMHANTAIDTKKMAQQCGFTTNDTFYTNFKQRCGVKPSQYLDQIIIKQKQG